MKRSSLLSTTQAAWAAQEQIESRNAEQKVDLPGFGNLEGNAGSNSRTVETMLTLDILHVRARLVEKGAALYLGCLKQKLLGTLPIVGRGERNAKHVQHVVMREGFVNERCIEQQAVGNDNGPARVLMAGLPRSNLEQGCCEQILIHNIATSTCNLNPVSHRI